MGPGACGMVQGKARGRRTCPRMLAGLQGSTVSLSPFKVDHHGWAIDHLSYTAAELHRQQVTWALSSKPGFASYHLSNMSCLGGVPRLWYPYIVVFSHPNSGWSAFRKVLGTSQNCLLAACLSPVFPGRGSARSYYQDCLGWGLRLLVIHLPTS